jgi:hypothetical protein
MSNFWASRTFSKTIYGCSLSVKVKSLINYSFNMSLALELEHFASHWREQIEEIKKGSVVNDTGCTLIRLQFEAARDDIIMRHSRTNVEQIRHSLNTVESELMVVLRVASSKFDLEQQKITAKKYRSIAQIFSSIAKVVRLHNSGIT